MEEVKETMEGRRGGDSHPLALPASACWTTCLTFTIHIFCVPMVVAGRSFFFFLVPPLLYCSMSVLPCPMLLYCVRSAQVQWHGVHPDWLEVYVVVHAHAVALWEELVCEWEDHCECQNHLCKCPLLLHATACFSRGSL